jgi:hypothetical protein
MPPVTIHLIILPKSIPNTAEKTKKKRGVTTTLARRPRIENRAGAIKIVTISCLPSPSVNQKVRIALIENIVIQTNIVFMFQNLPDL